MSESTLNKVERWNCIVLDLDNIVDGLGYHIDEGIKTVIAGFMVNGFYTVASCAGHLEKRFGKIMKLTPYIEIGLENKNESNENMDELSLLLTNFLNSFCEKNNIELMMCPMVLGDKEIPVCFRITPLINGQEYENLNIKRKNQINFYKTILSSQQSAMNKL